MAMTSMAVGTKKASKSPRKSRLNTGSGPEMDPRISAIMAARRPAPQAVQQGLPPGMTSNMQPQFDAALNPPNPQALQPMPVAPQVRQPGPYARFNQALAGRLSDASRNRGMEQLEIPQIPQPSGGTAIAPMDRSVQINPPAFPKAPVYGGVPSNRGGFLGGKF